MRIAVISDVHGNLIALDTVLRDVERESIDKIVALGDMIQSGPQPAEVVNRLQEMNCLVVMGNSDSWLLSGVETGAAESITGERFRKLHVVREWSLSRLSDRDRAYIESFSPMIHLELAQRYRFTGFHGTPTNFDGFIFPHTPESEFQDILMPYSDQILAGGHIHLPFVRRISDSFFFNPGSVGVTYNSTQDDSNFRLDPWAEYVILSVSDAHLGLEFRRVLIDVRELARVYRESGRPFAEETIAQYGEIYQSAKSSSSML
jgi:putative phosphoesterase